MKATGIIRRVDELGRVVIPMEIRKTLCILDNDPLEVFVDSGKVCFQKYQPAMDYIKHLQGISQLINEDNSLDAGMKEAICSGLNEAVTLLDIKASGN